MTSKHPPRAIAVGAIVTGLAAMLIGPAVPYAFARTLAVPTLVSNHMVLQRDLPDPIWGTAAPGARVTVRFNGETASAIAGADGTWRLTLAPMPATPSPRSLTITAGADRLTFRDVQVGEVWGCGGQSNMELALAFSAGGSAAAGDARRHDIRLFMAAWTTRPSQVTWAVASPETASLFSAACWYFGRELSLRLRVPIGLIQSTKGGTYIEEWTHASGGSCGTTLLARRDVPRPVAQLYETKIRPLMPYGIKGFVWYQGENNSRDCEAVYLRKLQGLVEEWRAAWGEGDFPFGIVQLPFGRTPATQAAQLQAYLNLPNTFLAVTTDLPYLGGSALHPANKEPVGLRLAIGARSVAYREPIEQVGPIVDPSRSYVSGSTVVIGFTHVGDGLVTGSEWQPTGAPGPFKLAGPSGGFHAATVTIVGDTLRVTCPTVHEPLEVRYTWTYGRGNLYSAVRIGTDGGAETYVRLPAVPFELTFRRLTHGRLPIPL